MNCFMCQQEITRGNYNPESKVTCWKCVMFLYEASQDKLKELHDNLMGKNLTEKASLIKRRFLKEDEEGEYGKAGRALDRGRPNRAVQTKVNKGSRTGRAKKK